MATTIHGTTNDVGRVVGVILDDDGTAADLSGASAIECQMRLTGPTFPVTVISGLSGSSVGAVSTTIPTDLPVGQYTMEWQVTYSADRVLTYPARGDLRPIYIQRNEAN